MKRSYRSKFDHDMDDDDQISVYEKHQMRQKKKFRNFDNALKSRNLHTILECTEYDEDLYNEEERYDD
jgi:peptide methionine sulfoxide reductase MsrB